MGTTLSTNADVKHDCPYNCQIGVLVWACLICQKEFATRIKADEHANKEGAEIVGWVTRLYCAGCDELVKTFYGSPPDYITGRFEVR